MKIGNKPNFFEEAIYKIFEKKTLETTKIIVERPLLYLIMAIFNLFFYFDDFSKNQLILFIFILSVITGLVVFLQKYKIINFLDASKPETIRKKFNIYFFIFIFIVGSSGGILLFIFEVIYLIEFLINSFIQLFF